MTGFHIKKYIIPFLLLSNLVFVTFSLFFGAFNPTVAATDNGTVVGIDPPLITENPDKYFTINVTITNVTNLYYWRVQMRWTRGLLRTHEENLIEGDFLNQGGETTTLFSKYTDEISRLDCSNSLFGQVEGVNGSGTLMTATFKVMHSGNTTLEIYDTDVLGINTTTWETYPIDHAVVNATFYTTIPVADFTYTPNPSQGIEYLGRPIVNETVTFNASTSYDPDDPYESTPGGIDSYIWDFGDGDTGTGQIATHSYNSSGLYTVRLSITDDDGETDWHQETINIQLHDIAIANVTVTPTEVLVGSTVTINATVLNKGSVSEYFNITAYYNYNPYFNYIPIETQTKNLPWNQNITATFYWDTTGLPEGNYTIAVDTLLINQFTLESRSSQEADLSDNGFIDGKVTITGTPRHDLAITDLKVSPTSLKVNQHSYIELTIKNEGNTEEHFNATITVYSGTTIVNTKLWSNMSLLAGTTTTLKLNWLTGSNTTIEGTYNVNASVRLIDAITLDFLSPYNASTPDGDPTDNTRSIYPPPNILMLPVAHFDPSATQVDVDQTVVFNATLSYAPGIPGGTITKYSWDFGDGVKVTQTSPIATHIYRTNGIFTVTLTVTDDTSLTSTTSRVIGVAPFHNIVVTNITFSPHILISGESASINVTVTARLFSENFNLTIYFNENEIDKKSDLTALFGGNATTHTFSWDTTGVAGGNYTIKALVASLTLGENTTYIAGTITILKIPVTLTLTAHPASLTVGDTVTINGTTSPALGSVTVTIMYRLSGEETWNTLPDTQTDSNGVYSQTWTPESAGTYAIKAIWQGDDTTEYSESQVFIATVQEIPSPSLFLYLSVVLTIGMAAMAFYFLKIWKPKA